MSRFNLTEESHPLPPPKLKRPYGPHRIGIEQQRFTVDGIDYRFIIPPHCGTRSAIHFLLHKKIIPYPKEYVAQYKADLYPGFLFMPNHLQIDPDDADRKIIVCIRNPVRAIISAIKMNAFDIAYIEKTDVITPDQLITATDHIMVVNHIKPIISYWLNGRKPDYILRAETQATDMLKLPFTKDLEGYKIHNDETTYNKDHFNHLNIVNRIKLSQAQQDIIQNHLRENYREIINKTFEEDMKEFGYANL